jgi:hypothetical protein
MSESPREKRDPRTLPEDIYALLDNETDHEVSEANVEWAGEAVKSLLRSRFKRRESRSGEKNIYMSSLGKKDRQMWYKANKPETAEKLPSKTIFKFLYGDMIEVLLLFLTKEAGHNVTHEQHRVEVDGAGGYLDAVVDGVVADCKSASPYSFEKFKSGDFVFNDPFGYIPQIGGYANALAEEEDKPEHLDRAGFLVADKVNGGICWAEVDEYTLKGNPPAPRIAHLKEVIAQPEPPERCYPAVPEGKSRNMKLGIECSYCDFHDECWKDANNGQGLKKYFYARGPVWLTDVKREPKVEAA